MRRPEGFGTTTDIHPKPNEPDCCAYKRRRIEHVEGSISSEKLCANILEFSTPRIVHVERGDKKQGQHRPMSRPQKGNRVLYDSETTSIYRKATYRVLFGRPLMAAEGEKSTIRSAIPAGSVFTSEQKHFEDACPISDDKDHSKSFPIEAINQISLYSDNTLGDLFTEHTLHQSVRENGNQDSLDLPSNIVLDMISGMEMDEYALPESETATLEPFRDADLIESCQLSG
uniref:AlNc14C159G7734 protein n=1 Tax=Albugo laibachii Nc14 TaxID=890382 RepID=F0WMP6_9STRA|nr:AlNc14C159G7734 [Albugo laibachii Nc14]|eukprot:CCA22580.1 AlNc14C159G7734 [Albugo laibachii Nc14]